MLRLKVGNMLHVMATMANKAKGWRYLSFVFLASVNALRKAEKSKIRSLERIFL